MGHITPTHRHAKGIKIADRITMAARFDKIYFSLKCNDYNDIMRYNDERKA